MYEDLTNSDAVYITPINAIKINRGSIATITFFNAVITPSSNESCDVNL